MAGEFTDAELSALRRAYAAGVLTVSYQGRTVTYGNAADLLSRIRELEKATGASASKPRSAFSAFSRGY